MAHGKTGGMLLVWGLSLPSGDPRLRNKRGKGEILYVSWMEGLPAANHPKGFWLNSGKTPI